MLYAIFCYDAESEIFGWSKERDAEVMASLEAVQAPLKAEGRRIQVEADGRPWIVMELLSPHTRPGVVHGDVKLGDQARGGAGSKLSGSVVPVCGDSTSTISGRKGPNKPSSSSLSAFGTWN